MVVRRAQGYNNAGMLYSDFLGNLLCPLFQELPPLAGSHACPPGLFGGFPPFVFFAVLFPVPRSRFPLFPCLPVPFPGLPARPVWRVPCSRLCHFFAVRFPVPAFRPCVPPSLRPSGRWSSLPFLAGSAFWAPSSALPLWSSLPIWGAPEGGRGILIIPIGYTKVYNPR